MTSPDGITWTVQSTSGFSNAWREVTYSKGVFVAVSSDGTGSRVMTSEGGNSNLNLFFDATSSDTASCRFDNLEISAALEPQGEFAGTVNAVSDLGPSSVFNGSSDFIVGNSISLRPDIEDSNIAAAWNMNDDTTIPDISGNGNTGTVNGPTVTVEPLGSSLNFTASNSDYIGFGNGSSLQITGDMTFSVWLKVGSPVATNVRIMSKDDNVNRCYLLNVSTVTGYLLFAVFRSGTVYTVTGTVDVCDGSWHHIVCVNDGANLLIYTDGVLDNSGTGGGSVDNDPAAFELGRFDKSGIPQDFFDGSMIYPAIYSDAKDLTWVKTEYDRQNPRNPAFASTDHSLFAWIKPDALTGVQPIISNGYTTATQRQSLFLDGSDLKYECSNGTILLSLSAEYPTDGEFHLVSVSKNENSGDMFAQLYIDGVLQDSGVITGVTDLTDKNLSVGTNGNHGPELIADFDMQNSGVGDWTPTQCTLTKETTDPWISGKQYLRARATFNNPLSTPNPPTELVPGTEYLATFTGRISPTDINAFFVTETTQTIGSVVNSQSWVTQQVIFTAVAGGSSIFPRGSGAVSPWVDGYYDCAYFSVKAFPGARSLFFGGEIVMPYMYDATKDAAFHLAEFTRGGTVQNAFVGKITNDPVDGLQALTVSGSDAMQRVLETGEKYRVIGSARSSNGVLSPQFEASSIFWTGTPSQDWQRVLKEFIATDTKFTLNDGDWDNLNITKIKNLVMDGYNEESSVSSYWSTLGTSLSFSTDGILNNAKYLKITSTGDSGTAYAVQSNLTINNYYHLTCSILSDGSAIPTISNNGVTLWTGTDVNEWQTVDIVFEALATDVTINHAIQVFDQWIGVDSLFCREADVDADIPPAATRTTEIGTDYFFEGWAKSDGQTAPVIKDGDTVVWTGSLLTTWQRFQIAYTATSTILKLTQDNIAGYVGFDDLLLSNTRAGGWNLVFFVAGENVEFDGTGRITSIEIVNIDSELRESLRRIILRHKPLQTWGALCVEFV
jgi:hypothetical protein